jgi:hypothetical protein
MSTLLTLLLALASTAPTTQPARHLLPSDRLSVAAIGDARHIILHGGTYALTEPLVLKPNYSGLTIEAAPGEKPIVSGGRRIDGWRSDTLNGHGCWSAEVPDVKTHKW